MLENKDLIDYQKSTECGLNFDSSPFLEISRRSSGHLRDGGH